MVTKHLLLLTLFVTFYGRLRQVLACPTDFTLIGGSCFYKNTEEKTHWEARYECQRKHPDAILTSVDDRQHADDLNIFVGDDEEYWTSAINNLELINKYQAGAYITFTGIENVEDGNKCVILFKGMNLKVKDCSVSNKAFPVYQKDVSDDGTCPDGSYLFTQNTITKCLKFDGNKMDYEDSVEAGTGGFGLVEIHSLSEAQYIYSFSGNRDQIWVGMKRDENSEAAFDSYKWTSSDTSPIWTGLKDYDKGCFVATKSYIKGKNCGDNTRSVCVKSEDENGCGTWTKIGNMCLWKNTNTEEQSDAARECKNYDAFLAYPLTNSIHMTLLREFVGNEDEYWIAATSHSTYSHFYFGNGVEMTYTGLEGYMSDECIYLHNGEQLKIGECDVNKRQLFQKDLVDGECTGGFTKLIGRCLLYVDDNGDYDEYLDEIQANTGYFAAELDEELASAVYHQITDEDVWVGMTRDSDSPEAYDSYTWSSGTQVTWTGMKDKAKPCAALTKGYLMGKDCGSTLQSICMLDGDYGELTTTVAAGTTTSAGGTEESTTTTANNEVQCPTGWQKKDGTGNCYVASVNSQTNTAASTLCGNAGGYLVTIPTVELLNWLKSQFSLTAPTYIGGSTTTGDLNYVWTISGKPIELTVSGSYIGDCLVLQPWNTQFVSSLCTEWKTFICEKGDSTAASATTVGSGSETTTVGSGNETTTVGSGSETATVGSGSETTTVGSGSETTTVGSGSETTTVGSGSETTTVGSGSETTTVGSGSETTTVGSGSETTTVGSGSETTTVGSGSETTVETTPTTGSDSSNGGSGGGTRRSGNSAEEPETGPWGDFNGCPETCIRGQVSRTRECLTPNLLDSDNNVCGNLPMVEIKDCLELDGCDGARYYLADEGISCSKFCHDNQGLVCSNNLQTGNTVLGFNNVVLEFSDDKENAQWSNDYGPYCKKVKGELMCGEYEGVPDTSDCGAEPPPVGYQRLCNCITSGDVGFGPWSPWSQCSQTCNGTATRSRQCFDFCTGPTNEVGSCGTEFCPIHGDLSEWSGWQPCSKTCDGGVSVRNRDCNNPIPQYDGNVCVGSLQKARDCNVQYCPVDAEWTVWSEWAACDKPCNKGHEVRRRTCSDALYGGNEECAGNSTDRLVCNEHLCTGKWVQMTLHFDSLFTPDMADSTNAKFQEFQAFLKNQVIAMYEDGEDGLSSVIEDVVVSTTRRGSIIANFTIYYSYLDSYQFMFFQDSVEIEAAVLKLPILPGLTDVTYVLGPKHDAFAEIPQDVASVSNSATNIYIWWTPITSSDLTGYIFFYRKRIEVSAPYHSFGIANTVSSANLTWLEPGVEYAFRILAYSSAGNGVATNLHFQRTMELIPSRAPTNTEATANGPFNVFVEWEGVSQSHMNGIPLGYNIYALSNGIIEVKNSSAYDMPSIIMHGLVPSTSYVFQVCAYNSVGDGPCERATAITLDSVPSSPPGNARVDEIKSFDQLTIKWEIPPANKIHGDLEGYKIISKPLATGTEIYMEPVETVFDVHSSLTDFTMRNLIPNTEYSIQLAAVNQHGPGVSIKLIGETCRCPPLVSSNFYMVPPYLTKTNSDLSGPFGEILSDVVKVSCGICKTANGDVTTVLDKVRNGRNAYAQKSSQLRTVEDMDTFTDLSFPIIGSKVSDEFMGYPFVSLVEHPGVVMLVKDKNISKIVLEMILLILGVWPLLLINLLMMVLAGFLVWLLEGFQTKTDQDFSTKWITGIKEGWYWAFITQGTQGYGDFAPRGISSRIFAIIWILVGLIMTSLLVGSIVTALTSVNNSSEYKIYGTECGALNASFEAKLGTLRNGKVNTKKAYTSVTQLKDALLDEDIEVVLLDAYTAGASKDTFSDPRIRAQQLIKYPRTYGFVLSGDLSSVSAEFKDYISVNEKHILTILTNTTEAMEPSPPAEVKSPFDPESVILKETLIIITVMLIVMSLAGYAFSIWREKRQQAKVVPESQSEAAADDDGDCENCQCGNEAKKMVDDFFESFCEKTEQTMNYHDVQRIKLHFDRGASSLRNDDDMYEITKKRIRKCSSVFSQKSAETFISMNDDVEANLFEQVPLSGDAPEQAPLSGDAPEQTPLSDDVHVEIPQPGNIPGESPPSSEAPEETPPSVEAPKETTPPPPTPEVQVHKDDEWYVSDGDISEEEC